MALSIKRNPDDLLVENWGTTDVTPDTYAIHTCSNTYPYLCACSNPVPMGTYTVEAGRVTYVGLFPVWLPYIRGNYNNWNSPITVRNNSGGYRAQVNTTFFNTDGTVNRQRTDYINSWASLTFNPPNNFTGAALIVSSEDVGVVVEQAGIPALRFAISARARTTWFTSLTTGAAVPGRTGT